MPAPVRYPFGIVNAKPKDIMGFMPLLDPSAAITYWNDFVDYVAGDWTSTVTGTGTSTLSSSLVGGNLVIANSAANGDAVFSQLKGNSFKYTSTKRLAFKARLKVDDITNAAFVIGLQETDTTPLDTANGLAFYKAAASTTMTAATEASNTQSSVTVTGVARADGLASTLANDTFFTVGFRYNPRGNSVDYYFNDMMVASTVLTNAPSANLTVSFGVQNGTAAARTLTLDYVLAMQER